MDETKSNETMATKLNKIAHLSRQDKRAEFKWLMPHFTQANLISCFNELDGKKAVGIDGKTKADYAENLEGNINCLIKRMKQLNYRPEPAREVLIPKGKDTHRKLGISTIEDKIIQMMASKLLEAIYEPLFCDDSYGYRRERSAHAAIKDSIEYLDYHNVKRVIDVDLENYFGTIRHQDILEMLAHKIKDKTFLRYISRLLKAGVQSKTGEIIREGVGLAQGSILSPVLSNIYAHYAIDLWLTKVVPNHIIGQVKHFRFCDDIIICCTDTRDTGKLICSLKKRLAKFGLTLNSEKTKVVKYNRYDYERGKKQESFDFLGFSFYLSRARKGGFALTKVKTSKKTLRKKLANVKLWLQRNRFRGGLLALWLEFCHKLRGHIVYFGVTNNGQSVGAFLQKSRRLFFKWMNRRSQKRSFNWAKFAAFEKQYPSPTVKIYHQLYGQWSHISA